MSSDEKYIVLEAINDSYFCHQNNLSYVQAIPSYYVLIMLDPTAKHERLHKTMETDEFNLRMNQVKNFIRMYVNEQRNELNNRQFTSTEPSVVGRKKII